MKQILLRTLCFCWWIFSVIAQDSDNIDPNDPGLDNDPYLQYKPEFARSLPVQILVTGVVLTLVAVLFIHIVFTAQYHWPLAPVNYILQLSGVITLLISLIATLHVVLSQTLSESERWPYMLSYIAVKVPPLDLGDNANDDVSSWSLAERATWLIMNATVSGSLISSFLLCSIHPRWKEGSFFSLLGPLAVVAAVMQLIPINTNAENVVVITSAVRNVCNATLSLLFTAALFLWGLLVNRHQAWRTDGGTAVFGAAALVLALASTALNFLYVPRQEEYVWLPGLMWAVVLWQSFLGWWWWVGAGSGHTTEDVVEEVLRRGERISRKRKERRRRARNANADADAEAEADADSTAVSSGTLAGGVLRRSRRRGTRARTHSPDGHHSGSEPEATTTYGSGARSGSGSSSGEAASTNDSAGRPRQNSNSAEENGSELTLTVSRSSLSSSGGASSIQPLPWFLPRPLYNYYASLRQAHLTAARKQAVERVERIRELERERENNQRSATPGSGWGLGSFAWRIGSSHRRYGSYDLSRDKHRNRDRYEAEDFEMHATDIPGRRRRSRDLTTSSGEDADDILSDTADGNGAHPPVLEQQLPRPVSAARPRTRDRLPSESVRSDHPATEERSGWRNSMWWWGPLKKWRLQDSTIY
ncbi:hypothetical protein D9758_005922 [Tetrapyrgos nigripes]|uniref:Uncharacterized protein n=1 Tax=Tetrapyrgos nigripes TaxID=182062 RepID=A0A8H5G340_9AGAR|nr:hypothetical protein D9758_005922 [Tetrapyrgos nigripes]